MPLATNPNGAKPFVLSTDRDNPEPWNFHLKAIPASQIDELHQAFDKLFAIAKEAAEIEDIEDPAVAAIRVRAREANRSILRLGLVSITIGTSTTANIIGGDDMITQIMETLTEGELKELIHAIRKGPKVSEEQGELSASPAA